VLTISGLGWWPKAASIQWFTDRGYTSFPARRRKLSRAIGRRRLVDGVWPASVD